MIGVNPLSSLMVNCECVCAGFPRLLCSVASVQRPAPVFNKHMDDPAAGTCVRDPWRFCDFPKVLGPDGSFHVCVC